jgi:hypothetical protein
MIQRMPARKDLPIGITKAIVAAVGRSVHPQSPHRLGPLPTDLGDSIIAFLKWRGEVDSSEWVRLVAQGTVEHLSLIPLTPNKRLDQPRPPDD